VTRFSHFSDASIVIGETLTHIAVIIFPSIDISAIALCEGFAIGEVTLASSLVLRNTADSP